MRKERRTARRSKCSGCLSTSQLKKKESRTNTELFFGSGLCVFRSFFGFDWFFDFFQGFSKLKGKEYTADVAGHFAGPAARKAAKAGEKRQQLKAKVGSSA